jgi:hypothetical protein
LPLKQQPYQRLKRLFSQGFSEILAILMANISSWHGLDQAVFSARDWGFSIPAKNT